MVLTRQSPISSGSVATRAVEITDDNRVQRWVMLFDACDHAIDELSGGNLSGAQRRDHIAR
jgi:hypothetical protein